MPGATVEVRRVLRSGAAVTRVRLPAGWAPVHLAAAPTTPPCALPAARSLPVPPGALLVVVNDAQRATPTPRLMRLLDCDWSSPAVRIAVATGCHAPPTEPELREIFGDLLDQVRPRIHVHRAAADPLLEVGTTRRGTPVQVNALLDWPAAVVCLGSVEPHYFAGWTGGRKSLVPGLCSLETMRANHRLAIEPGAAIGALADNPLHLDLQEACDLVCRRLLARGAAAPLGVNAVVARGEIRGWHAGPLDSVVEALAPRGRHAFGRPVEAPAPLVVCFVDHPLDRDVYQALKGFEHWKSAVAAEGILVLVADCPAGVGPPSFTQLHDASTTLAAIERRARADYRLGDHKLLNLRRFVASGRRLWLVSPHAMALGAPLLPIFDSVEAAVLAAGRSLPPGPRRALLVEDGATLFPLPPRAVSVQS
jgi:nickel-dependent lactate racemase